jgi:hypothetical protein
MMRVLLKLFPSVRQTPLHPNLYTVSCSGFVGSLIELVPPLELSEQEYCYFFRGTPDFGGCFKPSEKSPPTN